METKEQKLQRWFFSGFNEQEKKDWRRFRAWYDLIKWNYEFHKIIPKFDSLS